MTQSLNLQSVNVHVTVGTMAAPEAAPSHSAPSPSSVASAPSEAAAPSNEVVLAQAIQLSPDATACSPQPPLSEPSSVTLASPNQASLQQQLYGSAGRSEQEGQDLYRLKIVGIPAGARSYLASSDCPAVLALSMLSKKAKLLVICCQSDMHVHNLV